MLMLLMVMDAVWVVLWQGVWNHVWVCVSDPVEREKGEDEKRDERKEGERRLAAFWAARRDRGNVRDQCEL